MTPREYHVALGLRLRAVRRSKHLSLAEVEQKSHGEWKAVVVGSYERGDRAITVGRLAALAEFYGVPTADVLPDGREAGPPLADAAEVQVLRAVADRLDAALPQGGAP